MNIHEHQAKQILKKYGASVPKGDFAFSTRSSTVRPNTPSGTTAPYFFKICFA